MDGIIYALCDPETYEIRYIGQTTDMVGRLKAHFHHARRGDVDYKNHWIRSVFKRGLEPDMQILDAVSVEHLDAAEVEWIKNLRELGYRLTNANDGGVGNRGWRASDETKERMSKVHKERCADPVERARLASISNGEPPVRHGEANHKAKLTAEKVAWLRREAKAGREIAELGRELKVTPQAAWYAATGKTWKTVDELPVESVPRERYTIEQIEEMRRMDSEGISREIIIAQFDVSPSHLSHVINDRRGAVPEVPKLVLIEGRSSL